MGKYRSSAIIQSISGNVGDVTFTSYKGTPTLRKRVRRHRQPYTTSQLRMEGLFVNLIRSWRYLSFSDWAFWSDYACYLSGNRSSKRSGLMRSIGGSKLTGINAYVSVNLLLMGCGFPQIDRPVFGGVGKPPLVKTDLRDFGMYNGEVSFNVWLPSDYEAECVVQVWVQKLLGHRNHSYIANIVPLSTTNTEVVIDKLRVKEGGTIVERSLNSIGNCRLLIQFRVVAANGQFSVPSAIYRVEVRV